MQFTLQCLSVGMVLLSLAPSTLTFSRGASHASCRDMIPGHIRAQSQDPQRSHVTLRTSASSYLPGQLITVTVRSSRDFMGFLLQARSVEGAGGSAEVGAGVRSTRVSPVLVGGSWTPIPPGTHTLRCLSEGDTLTHSDKQLKRNLSFMWRAPDAPMGDIRFYITVVRSYFVYWAGIESAVVRDGSRRPWSGNNITGVDGANSIFALQEDEVTALPALGAHRASHKQKNKTDSPATSLAPPTPTSSGTESNKSQEALTEVTGPVLEMNSSVTLASLVVDHLTNQADNKRNSPTTLGSLKKATKGSETEYIETSGSLSGATEEAGTDIVSSVTHTEDLKSSLLSFNHLLPMASSSSANAREMESTTTLLPNITVQNSTSPLFLLHSLASLPPLKDSEIERNFQDPKLLTVLEINDTTLNPETTTTAIPSTNRSFDNTNAPRPKSQNPKGLMQGQTSSVKVLTQSSLSQPWRSSLTKSQISLIKDEMGSQHVPQPQKPYLKPFLRSQTSSLKPFLQVQTSPSKPLLQFHTGTSQTFPFSQASSSKPFSKIRTSSPNLFIPSKIPTLQSHTTSSLQPIPNKLMSSLPKPQPENSPSGPKTILRQTSSPHPQLQTTASLSSPSQHEPLSSFPQALPRTIPTQTQGQATFFAQTEQSSSSTPPEALSISPQPLSQPLSQTGAPQVHTFGWKQTQSSVTPRSTNPLPFTRFYPTFTMDEGKEVKDLQAQAKLKTMSPIFASSPSTTPSPSLSVSTRLPTLHSSSISSSHTLAASSLGHSTTPLYSSGGSTLVFKPWPWAMGETSFTHGPLSSSPSSASMKNQPKTAQALSALPSPSPISIPPHFPSVQPSSTSPTTSSTSSTIPSSNYPSPAPLFYLVPLSTSSSSPFTSSQSITGSTISLPSFSIVSPTLSSSTATSTSFVYSPSSPLPPHSSSISTSSSSSNSSFTSSSLASFQSTSPHLGPSPAPFQSLYNPQTSTPSPVPSQQLTRSQMLPIRNHIASSNPEPNLDLPTPRTVVHPNPEPHPKLDPTFKQNLDNELKPNLLNTDTKPKPASNPSATPDKEGKYPDIIPRHSAWELGMLLGCSAGLGMVLVVGIRYMYRQACGKQTEVTLNDRESEYGRRERGLLHVQECGDLVRVRRIRENSFVLLAEYDILASPGD